MNYNISCDNYNNSRNPLSDKLCKTFSNRGIHAVKGYSAEALGCKSPEETVRDMRNYIAGKMPAVYPIIKNAAQIAARKKDEERVASLSADANARTSVIGRIVGIEKKPGEYSRREIIKKADAAVRDLERSEEPEKYVRTTRFPISALASVLVCSVVAMFLVFSGAMIKDVSDDITSLRNESAALAEKEHELSLELEIKNDLRVIEQIAVNELGMIKKDFITKNYITMSGEDSVEVYDNAADESGSAPSTLLSAISEQFGRFMEYID